MIEAGVKHALSHVKLRTLLEITDAQVIAVDAGATVLAFFPRENREQCGLPGTVLCNESDLLSLGN